MKLDLQRLTLITAEKLREIATRQGNVPFDKGDLRKAHVVEPIGKHDALLAANTPYARAVHDGRPAITIKPKRKKALKWKGGGPVKAVRQPARKGNPWLIRAVEELEREGGGFLADEFGDELVDAVTKSLRERGLQVRQRG